jgi:hypothetical protein
MCGEERCARQRAVTKLPLEQRELGMVARGELAAKGFANNHTIAGHDCSDLRRDPARLTFTLAS